MHKEDSFSLNSDEMAVVNDIQFFLTKQIIVEKVYGIFARLNVEMEVLLQQKLPQLNGSIAKISKGENYQGLPYIMLDSPRLFGKEDVFAIRCFFWWGNFFSITLQMSGSYLTMFERELTAALESNLFEGWYISCGDNLWQHHFEGDNYALVKSENKISLVGRPFIKLAKKIPLFQWDIAFEFYKTNFEMIINLLSNQAPMR